LIKCPQINDKELEELNENGIGMNCNILLDEDFERYEYRIRRFYTQNSVFSENIEIDLNIPLQSVEQEVIEGSHEIIEQD